MDWRGSEDFTFSEPRSLGGASDPDTSLPSEKAQTTRLIPKYNLMMALGIFVKFFVPCRGNDFRPPFLESGLLIAVVGAFLLLKIINISVFIYLPRASFFAEITQGALLELTNQKRLELGIPPLVLNPTLSEAAYLKAKDMLDKDYFSHTSPTGTTPWFWFEESGYSYAYAGENLGIGFIDSKQLFDAWYNSPSHRTNIENPNYREMGIAVLKGNFKGNETTVAVHFFGTPAQTRLDKKNLTGQAAQQIPWAVSTPAGAKQKPPTKSAPAGSEIPVAPPAPETSPTAAQENEQISPNVQVRAEGITTGSPTAKTRDNFYLTAFEFLASGYGKATETAIRIFLGALVGIFLLTIILNSEVRRRKNVLLKTFGIIIVLLSLLAINNELLAGLLSSNLKI